MPFLALCLFGAPSSAGFADRLRSVCNAPVPSGWSTSVSSPGETRQKKGVSNHNTRQTFDVLKSSFGKRLVLNTALPSCPPHIGFIKRGQHMLFSKRLTTFGIAIAALLTPLASADALPPVRAGILQCQGGQNVGFVVGSVTSLECVFKSEGRR